MLKGKTSIITALLMLGIVTFTGMQTVQAETISGDQEQLAESIEESIAEEDDDPEYPKAVANGYGEFYDSSRKYALASGNYEHNSRYADYQVIDGIDVSKYQGDIDWAAVKNAGVEYAIIRVGYRGYGSGTLQEDPYFRQNIQGALNAGLKVGVYIFSQAVTDAEAREEAQFLLDRISGYNITLPVVLDFEYVSTSSGTGGRLYDANLSVDAATSVCNSFCAAVASAGYTPMVYANKSMLENHLNASAISNTYKIWLANYTTKTTYGGAYDFWQYSSHGLVSGINGYVDCNFWYVPNAESQADSTAGMTLVQGQWRAVIDGRVDYDYTGMALNEYGWWYFSNGELDWDYTGYGLNEYGYWWYQNGQIDFGYTGMACDGAYWRYVKDGYVDMAYTGMALNEYGWWYFCNGDLIWDYTGMALNEYGWWYFSNGELDWDYTGYGLNEYGYWWYQNGQIDFSYTGMACDGAYWRYVRDGYVDMAYTGMALNEYGWWYFSNGDLIWDYTGIASNEYGSWYFAGGHIAMDYTGEVQYGGNTYQVVNGMVV